MKKYKNVLFLLILFAGRKIFFHYVPGSKDNLFLLYLRKLSYAGCVIFLSLWFLNKEGISLKSFRIFSPLWARDMLIGVGAYLFLIPVLFFTTYAGKYLVKWLGTYEQLAPSTGPPGFTSPVRAMLYAVYTISVMPFIQELFFRGALFTSLKSKTGFWPALLFTSLLFSIIHFNLFWFVSFFILGLFFGYIYYRTGSLMTAIAAHAANNTVALFIYFLY